MTLFNARVESEGRSKLSFPVYSGRHDAANVDAARKALSAFESFGHAAFPYGDRPLVVEVREAGDPQHIDTAPTGGEERPYTYMDEGVGPAPSPLTTHLEEALALIAEERRRQVSQEGWTEEHDDGHVKGELALAAAAYAVHAVWADRSPTTWPFERDAWKPSEDELRDLVKAGALIAAEIDRILRARAAGRLEAP